MVITKDNLLEVLEKVRTNLSDLPEARRLDLKVSAEESRLEDDYLYVCVYPAAKGIRPYDYAQVLTTLEDGLHRQGYDNVVVVPGFYD